jgi:hypothetical protein
MSDLMKFKGDNCPLKQQCKRFTASEGSQWQPYFDIPPYEHDQKDCKHFWSNETE